jgi:hypothetical protein
MLADNPDIEALKRGVLTKKQPLKNNSFKTLLAMAQENPGILYTDWDFFAGLIEPDKGADTKYIGLYIIAHLTAADNEGKFKKLFDSFYALLDDDSLIPAAHVSLVSGIIVNNLPELESRITNKLLEIEATHHAPGRRDLIKSYIIEAFDTYFDKITNSADRKRILAYITAQQECLSPKTEKCARAFIKKWEAAV